jgi:hypothetical protein
MWGGVCANADAPSTSTTVTVTLPDGVKGSIQIFVIAKGQPARPAVVYAPQPPLRLHGSPEYAPGFVPAQRQVVSRGSATGGAAATGGGATASAPPPDPTSDPAAVIDPSAPLRDPTSSASASNPNAPTATPANPGTGAGSPAGAGARVVLPRQSAHAIGAAALRATNRTATVTAATLTMTGTYHVLSPAVVTASAALTMTGTYHTLPPVLAATATLTMSGTHASPSIKPRPVQSTPRIPAVPQPHTP